MKTDYLSRRAFLKTSLAIGAGCYGLKYLNSFKNRENLKEFKSSSLKKGVVVVQIADKALIQNDSSVYSNSSSTMYSNSALSTSVQTEETIITEATRRGINALGGMDKLVSRGDKVVIKPNIAWNRKPEFAANTNPFVVAALVTLCIEAGASKVTVLDNTCSTNPRPSYVNSGIELAAKKAGANTKFIDKQLAQNLIIPQYDVLDSWIFLNDFVDADQVDVLINVPIAKHHSTSRLSMAMKNVFGMIGGDRGKLHKDIHSKIADLNRVVKIDLTVLDAYRTLRAHGPTGGRLEDVDNSFENARKLIIGTDPVAVDSFGATLFDLKGEDLKFLRKSHEAGLGEIDYKLNGFETIVV